MPSFVGTVAILGQKVETKIAKTHYVSKEQLKLGTEQNLWGTNLSLSNLISTDTSSSLGDFNSITRLSSIGNNKKLQ